MAHWDTSIDTLNRAAHARVKEKTQHDEVLSKKLTSSRYRMSESRSKTGESALSRCEQWMRAR